MNPAALSFSNVYDSFKNNDYEAGSLTISGVVGAGALGTWSGTVPINNADSVTQIYFSTSVNSLWFSIGNVYILVPLERILHDDGSTPSFPGTAVYDLAFSVQYGATELTLTVSTWNQGAEALTVVTETISFQVYTFIAPFSS